MSLTELEQFDNLTRPDMPRSRLLFGAKSAHRANDMYPKPCIIGEGNLSLRFIQDLRELTKAGPQGLKAAFRAFSEQVPAQDWRNHLQMMGCAPTSILQGIDATQVYADLANALLECGAGAILAQGMMSVMGIRELHRASRKVYEVAPGLCEMLHHTELRGLRGKHIKLPYETVFIQIPPGFVVETTDTVTVPSRLRRSQGASFTGIYVHELVNDEDNYKGPIKDGGPSRVWTLVCFEASDPFDAAKPFTGTNLIFNLHLYDNLKVEESIAASIQDSQQMEKVLEEPGTSRVKTVSKKNGATETWAQAFKLVMNLMMYLHSPDAEILFAMDNKEARDLKARIDKLPKGGKKEDLKSRYKTLDPRYRYRVGLGMSMKAVTAALESKQQKFQTNGPLLVRTEVSGHYRRTHPGPRVDCVPWAPLEERQELWTWVKPYWKGDLSLPVSSPVRLVT